MRRVWWFWALAVAIGGLTAVGGLRAPAGADSLETYVEITVDEGVPDWEPGRLVHTMENSQWVSFSHHDGSHVGT